MTAYKKYTILLMGVQSSRNQNLNISVITVLQIAELEEEKRELEKTVNELKAKCEQIEKRAQEQRQVEEKKHTEEIQFLKRTNQQLKVLE